VGRRALKQFHSEVSETAQYSLWPESNVPAGGVGLFGQRWSRVGERWKKSGEQCALRRGIANFMTSYFAAIGDFGAARDLSFHNLI
jgi:uncharacterized protein YbdZ (MbtH family)